MTPQFQERHQDYVLGPNQDGRLASVLSGAVVEGVELRLDGDAPFALRGRAVRCVYDSGLTQAPLQGLKTRWQDSTEQYRQQDFTPEALQMANFGQGGNPMRIFPSVVYPANGVIRIDLRNDGPSTITNLTFYWRGVKLYPWGSVPFYKYPAKFAGLGFGYPIPITALAANSGIPILNQIFTVKQDADFVIRGLQANVPQAGATPVLEVFVRFKDFDYKPYSNDFVHLDVIAGRGGWPATIPIDSTPDFLSPFGVGPALPGLVYPEIYVPANYQMLYDVKREDTAAGVTSADLVINLLGQKVFPR